MSENLPITSNPSVGGGRNAAHVQILHNLQAIIPEWWELFHLCPDATPFQSPAWLLPWWSCFGCGDPKVITVRHHTKLVGLGLFYVYSPDVAAHPKLFFIGKAVSDYLDLLVAPGEYRAQVAREILDCALSRIPGWETAELDRLPPSSPILQLPRPASARDGTCPEVALNGHDLEDFVTRRSTIINLRNRGRRAHKAGNVEFVTADDRNYKSLMNALVALHSNRMCAVGLPGMFSDPNMTKFLRDAGRQLLRAGMLRLHAMRLNGTNIAVLFGLLQRKRAYLYNFGFDPQYAALAPATQLIAFAMKSAAAEGAEIYDFLQGDEPYKFETWGAQRRYTYRVAYQCATDAQAA